MNKICHILFTFAILFSLATSCTKTADSPPDKTSDSTSTIVPVIGGATSIYKDTVSYTVGNVTILYSKTSQCYPSNEIFAFTASATNFPSNAIYKWDFGDGHTISGAATVGNIYQDAGYYTVTLTITDVNGQKLNTTTVNVKAFGQQVTPHASFYAQIFDIKYPNNMNFNANGSTVPRGKINNYLWNWGDGTTTSGATPDNTEHNFNLIANDTTYPVQLIVTASSGCTDTAFVPVSITATYHISGDFDVNQYDKCTAEYFIFTPKLQGAPSNVTYAWDFSDATGTATSNSAINHTFTYQNTYDVKMYVFLKGKIIYTAHKSIITAGQNIRPKALFFKNVNFEDANLVKWAMYSAANVPHGYISSYEWYVDNVSIDNNTNSTYELQAYQKGIAEVNHTIKFIVTGNTGCKDTSYATIKIPVIGQYTY